MAAGRGVVSWQGVPGIHLSSLFGAQNWQEGVEQTGRARTINRRKFDAETLVMQLSDSGSLYDAVYQAYRQLLDIRTSETAFHPLATQIIHPWSPAVFAVERIADDGSRLLALHNVTDQSVDLLLPDGIWQHLFSQTGYQSQLRLSSYQIAWLKNRSAE